MFKKKMMQMTAIVALAATCFTSTNVMPSFVRANAQTVAQDLVAVGENVSLTVSKTEESNRFRLSLSLKDDFDKSITCLQAGIQFDASKINDLFMTWASSLNKSHVTSSYDASTGLYQVYVVDRTDLIEQGKIDLGTIQVESNEPTSFISAMTLDYVKIVDLAHSMSALTPLRETITFDYTVAKPVKPPVATPTPTPVLPPVQGGDNGSGNGNATGKPSQGGNSNVTPTVKPTAPVKKVPVTSVKLNKKKASIAVGEKTKLVAKVAPSNATNQKLKWTTSDASVAKVTSTGVVTGLKKGTATITAMSTDGSKVYAKATVTVKEVKVKKITVSTSKVTLAKGKTKQLKVTVAPSNATDKTVTYKSSNKKAATVSKTGKITAKAKGRAIITVKASNGMTNKVTVIVK